MFFQHYSEQAEKEEQILQIMTNLMGQVVQSVQRCADAMERHNQGFWNDGTQTGGHHAESLLLSIRATDPFTSTVYFFSSSYCFQPTSPKPCHIYWK